MRAVLKLQLSLNNFQKNHSTPFKIKQMLLISASPDWQLS